MKTCGMPLSSHESIQCARWLLKRKDTCSGFKTKDGLLKEIATLLYTLIAILIL